MTTLVVVATVLMPGLFPPTGSCQTAAGLLAILQPGGASPNEILPDGFRSAFDDEHGWWSLGRTEPTPRLRLTREHNEPVTRRLTDGEASVLDRSLRAEASVSFAGKCVDWTTGLRFVDSDRVAGLTGHDGDARLAAPGSRLEGCVRAATPAPGLSLQASAPLWRQHGDETGTGSGWGLRYESSAGWAAQVARTVGHDDEAFLADILDEPVPLRVNLEARSWRLAARARLGGRLQGEITRRTDDYGPDRPLQGAAIYQCQPEGRGDGLGGSLILDTGAGHELLYRYTDESVQAETTLSWSGARFGRVEAFRFDLRSHLLGWRWRANAHLRPRLECELDHVDAFGHASLQSWPFTETVIDLLGVKQVFMGTLTADWRRLTLAADVNAGPLDGCIGFSWYRIEPSGVAESWRRTVVFGVDEYEREALDLRRIDLTSALLGATLAIGRQEAFFSVQQFFWGAVKHRNAISPPPTPPTGEGTRHDGWYGGTYLTAGMTLRP